MRYSLVVITASLVLIIQLVSSDPIVTLEWFDRNFRATTAHQ